MTLERGVNDIASVSDTSTVNYNAMNQSALSVLDMPYPNSKQAPTKFKGDYTAVENFLEHYEKLCMKNRVTSDKDRCCTVTQYCSHKVVKVIEGLEAYQRPNWHELKREILRLFNADLNKQRYNLSMLKKIIHIYRERKLKSWSQFTKYVRDFTVIGGWLRGKGKITTEQEATYFWKGIPKAFRHQLENCLLAQDPDHDM